MSITAKRQTVHKTGLLHLPAMSGEDMHKFNHLMHDTRSEFSKNIKSYNMAVTTTMNRHLSQSLKDVNTTIESLNRSQQKTYKTMCKIICTQRKKLKETYQRYQQNLRESTDASTSNNNTPRHLKHKVKRAVLQGQKLPPLEDKVTASSDGTARPIVTDYIDDVTAVVAQVNAISSVPINTTDSIEESQATASNNSDVDKSNMPANPSDSESEAKAEKNMNSLETNDIPSGEMETLLPKLILNFPSRTSTKKAFFTASLRPTLPPINETLDAAKKAAESSKLLPQSNAISFPRSLHPYAASSKAGSSVGRGSYSPDPSTSETAVSAQKAVSLRARIADMERQHIQEFLKKQNLETKLKPYQLKPGEAEEETMTSSLSSGAESKVPKSIAAERRRLAKLRVAHRKAVLNSEDNYMYTQLSDGSFLQGARAYKRKRFLPPSNRAQQQRNRILKSEAVQAEMNEEKIGQFFNKLDIPAPKEMTKKALKRKETKAAIDLSDITPVVVQPVKREKSVIPLNEVAKNVAYIRQYIRPSDRPTDMPHNTSWSQYN